MKRSSRYFIASLLLGIGVFFGGCQTTNENAAPTVQSLASKKGGTNLTTLEHGRAVFLRSCAECHTLQPIQKYSVARWQEIIAIMAPRARLSASDRTALEAYLVTARKSYPN